MAKRKTTPKAKKPVATKKRATRKATTPSVRSMSLGSSTLTGRMGAAPGDLELTVSGITLDPDPPAHNQSFTVSATVTPAGATITTEVYVNGVLRCTKTGASPTFSPAELGN